MQPAGDHHRQIGEPILGIAQDSFNRPRAFDTGDGMFNAHAYVRNALIVLFLRIGQLTLARLFFGW